MTIQADEHLPDLVLVNLRPSESVLMFVEVVATDGAISERRRAALSELENIIVMHSGMAKPLRPFSN